MYDADSFISDMQNFGWRIFVVEGSRFSGKSDFIEDVMSSVYRNNYGFISVETFGSIGGKKSFLGYDSVTGCLANTPVWNGTYSSLYSLDALTQIPGKFLLKRSLPSSYYYEPKNVTGALLDFYKKLSNLSDVIHLMLVGEEYKKKALRRYPDKSGEEISSILRQAKSEELTIKDFMEKNEIPFIIYNTSTGEVDLEQSS